jgi:hypothetical protein
MVRQYTNGETAVVNLLNTNVYGWDAAYGVVGTHVLTVKYAEGGVEAMTTFKVTIREASNSVLQPKTITENGTYTADEGFDGFGTVTVNVPSIGTASPVLQEKTATANGTYYPDSGYDGLSKVTVNVPIPDGYIQPSGTTTITANGTYDVAQYSQAIVALPEFDGTVVIN